MQYTSCYEVLGVALVVELLDRVESLRARVRVVEGRA